ncbi:MAG TPA: START-like domain-containing protein [Bacteroidales bacterium]|nr:START-like domain-containing protein [Bacteroidales bacterium]
MGDNKVKIQQEYVINCSPKVLYNRLSTASGLAEWFADDVRVQGKRYTFFWEGSEQTAEIVQRKENKLVRFQWLDEEDTYFEFRITQDELTNDVSLIVIDNIEEDEQEETKELWDTQIADLKHVLGS